MGKDICINTGTCISGEHQYKVHCGECPYDRPDKRCRKCVKSPKCVDKTIRDKCASNHFSEYEMDTMKPYVVTIEEISRRTIVVWGDNCQGEGDWHAENYAEALCNNGDIDLDFEDFQERSCTIRRVATEADLKLYPQYGK